MTHIKKAAESIVVFYWAVIFFIADCLDKDLDKVDADERERKQNDHWCMMVWTVLAFVIVCVLLVLIKGCQCVFCH